jgi:hypothetical protein
VRTILDTKHGASSLFSGEIVRQRGREVRKRRPRQVPEEFVPRVREGGCGSIGLLLLGELSRQDRSRGSQARPSSSSTPRPRGGNRGLITNWNREREIQQRREVKTRN